MPTIKPSPTKSFHIFTKLSPLPKMRNQASPWHSDNSQLLSILSILLELENFQGSDHLWIGNPPFPLHLHTWQNRAPFQGVKLCAAPL